MLMKSVSHGLWSLALLVLVAPSVSRGAVGDSETTALLLSMPYSGFSSSTQNVVSNEFGTYGFYWKSVLSRNTGYTFRFPSAEASRTFGPMQSMSVDVGSTTRASASFTPCGSFKKPGESDSYAYYLLSASGWASDDPATAVFYVNVSGEKGSSVSVEYGTGNLLPQGTSYNPGQLSVGSDLSTANVALLANDQGQGEYTYSVQLTQGMVYYFRTDGATENNPATISFDQPVGIEALSAPSGNQRLVVRVSSSGSYALTVRTLQPSDSVRLTYGPYSERKPAQHSPAAVACAAAVNCQPGRMHADAAYQDDVIDEQLFKFDTAGAKGTSFYVESTAASADVLAIVYDETGRQLKVSRSQADGCLRFGFDATGLSSVYLGICQDVDDVQPITCGPISFVIHDVADEGVVRYDAADCDDDTAEGATTVAVTAAEQVFARMMWGSAPMGPDAEDWFAFDVRAGYSYNLRFADRSGHLRFSLHDADGVELGVSNDDVLVHTSSADGRLFVKVYHAAGYGTEDAAYSLAVKFIEAGTIRFASATYEVDETSDYVTISLVRSSVPANRAYYHWGTVSAVAEAGKDYRAEGGTFVWQGDSPTAEIRIPLLPEMRPSVTGNRKFYVRLGAPEDVELGYDDCAPLVAKPDVATVIIRECDVQPVFPPTSPSPSVDPDYVTKGSSGMELAYGAFSGVLTLKGDDAVEASQKAGKVELTTTNGIRAVVTIGGVQREFYTPLGFLDKTTQTLSAELTCEGSDDVLSIVLDNRAIYTLKTSLPEDSGSAELALTLEDVFGPLTVEYSARLYRDNRAEGPYHVGTAAYAGRYTVALVPATVGAGEPAGIGYATVRLEESGEASVAGRTADGTAFDERLVAVVSTAAEGSVIRLPLCADMDGSVLSGVLEIARDAQGGRIVRGSGQTVWHGEAFTRLLVPSGRFYDHTISPSAIFARYDLVVEDDGSGMLPADALRRDLLVVDQETGAFFGQLPTLVVGIEKLEPVFGVFFTPDENGADPVALGSVADGLLGLSAVATPVASSAEDWGFDVTVSLGIYDEIEARAGSEAVIPQTVPEGDGTRVFHGWRSTDGNILKPGDTFRMPPEDATFAAVWTRSTAGFAQALDSAPELTDGDFIADGSVAWSSVDASAAFGGTALGVANMSARGMAATLETEVSGVGEVSFAWSFSRTGMSAGGSSQIQFFVDDEKISELNVATALTPFAFKILTNGPHRLKWVVTHGTQPAKKSQFIIGAQIDNLHFTPYVKVMFDANGGTCGVESVMYPAGAASVFSDLPTPTYGKMEFQGWYDAQGVRYQDGDAVPQVEYFPLKAKWGYPQVSLSYLGGGASGQVPAASSGRYPATASVAEPEDLTAPTGYRFYCWDGSDGKTYLPGEVFQFGSDDVSLSAHWRPSTAGFANALDIPALSDDAFDADGAGPWITVEDGTAVGGTALRSSDLSAAESSIWTEMTVDGEGIVSFGWQLLYATGTRSDTDVFRVEVDGEPVGMLTEPSDGWQPMKIRVSGTGAHIVRWTVFCGATGASCYGMLDNVSFAAPVRLTFDAAGGTCEVTEDEFGAGTRLFGLPVPEPTSALTGMEFYEWRDASGKSYADGDVVPAVAELALTAYWDKIRYRLTYEANGASGTVPAEQRGCYRDTVEVQGADGLTVPGAYSAFACWRSGDRHVYRAGEAYEFGPSNDVLTAVWTKSVDGFAAALDCTGSRQDSDFVSDGVGVSSWRAAEDASAEGSTAVNAYFSTQGSAFFKTTVVGSGCVTFRAKLATGGTISSGSVYFTFSVDGQPVQTVQGSSAWADWSFDVTGGGAHELEWKLVHGASSKKGTVIASASVDALTLAFGNPVTVTFDPNGGQCSVSELRFTSGQKLSGLPVPEPGTQGFEGLEFYDWRDGNGVVYKDGDAVPDVSVLALTAQWGPVRTCLSYDAGAGSGVVPDPQSGASGVDVVKVASADGLLSPLGFAFDKWQGSDGATYRPGDDFVFKAQDIVLTAQWKLSPEGYSAALDCPGVSDESFVPAGSGVWLEVEDTTSVGGTALRGQDVAAGESLVNSLTVEGSQVVEFAWQLEYVGSQRSGVDTFVLSVDGMPVRTLLEATAGWQSEKVLVMGAGEHVLTWSVNRAAGDAYECRVALDNLRLGPAVVITYDANGGSCAKDGDFFRRGTQFQDMPEPVHATLCFGGWREKGTVGKFYKNGDTVPDEDVTLEAVWDEVHTLLIYDGDGAAGTPPETQDGVPGRDSVVVAGQQGLVAPVAGQTLAYWLGDDNHPYSAGDIFSFQTDDVTLKPVWGLGAEGLAEAADCSAAMFKFNVQGGTWTATQEASAVGGSAAMSATGMSSSLEIVFYASNEGDLSFDWKATIGSYQSKKVTYRDTYRITLDGLTVLAAPVASVATWTATEKVHLTEGLHRLTCVFTKAQYTSGGFGAIDNIRWNGGDCKVTVQLGQYVASATQGTQPVVSGQTLSVAQGDALQLTVTATDWHTPTCNESFVTTTSGHDAATKTFTVTPSADCTVTFEGSAKQGDPTTGLIVVGGKMVPASKAVPWATTHGVQESEFAAVYDDYLLNEAPGAGGGIKISTIALNANGQIALTVVRTKDCFALDKICGEFTVWTTDDLAVDFTECPAVDREIVSTADTTTVLITLPQNNVRFVKAVIR